MSSVTMPDQSITTVKPLVAEQSSDASVSLDPQVIELTSLIGEKTTQTQTLGLHTTRTTPDQKAPFGADHDSSTLGAAGLGKTGLGLLVVIGLIFGCTALLKRFGPYKRLAGQSLKVIASQSVGQRERVVIVEVENTWLVLGVAPGRVNTLHTLPAKHDSADDVRQEDLLTPSSQAPSSPPSFSEAFSDNLRRAMSRFSRNDRNH